MRPKTAVSRQVRRAEERKEAKLIAKKLRRKRRKEQIGEPQDTEPQQSNENSKSTFENTTRILGFCGHLLHFLRAVLGLFGLL